MTTTTNTKNLFTEGLLFLQFNREEKISSMRNWLKKHRIELISHVTNLSMAECKVFCEDNDIEIPVYNKLKKEFRIHLHGNRNLISHPPEKMDFCDFVQYTRSSQLKLIYMLQNSFPEKQFNQLVKEYFGLSENYKYFVNLQKELKSHPKYSNPKPLSFIDPFAETTPTKELLKHFAPAESLVNNPSVVIEEPKDDIKEDINVPNSFITSVTEHEHIKKSDFFASVDGVEIKLNGIIDNVNLSIKTDNFSFNIDFSPNKTHKDDNTVHIEEADLPF